MGVINGFVDGTNSGASPRKVPATAPEAFRIFKSLRFAGRQFFLGGHLSFQEVVVQPQPSW